MPTIEMSPALYSGLAARIIGPYTSLEDNIYGKVMVPSTGSETYSYFCIMQGTVPTDVNTIPQSRMADTLVFWKIGPSFANPGEILPITVGTTTTINSYYKAAIATGTATWFQWCTRAFAPPSTASSGGLIYINYSHIIMGTVGLVGSGADFEIPDVNIVTGQQYRMSNFKLTFPSSWSY